MRLRASFDSTLIDRALVRFLAGSKRRASAVLVAQGGRLVKDVVARTPPNSNTGNGSTGFRDGKRRIATDIRKIYVQRAGAPPVEPRVYDGFRTGRGRVKRRSLGRNRLPASNVAAFVRQRQSRIGILASGFNAAAARLNVRLPWWVTRHGPRRGSVAIDLRGSRISVIVRNGVRFSGDVTGLDRRIQAALDARGAAMLRQVENYEMRQAAREAGL